MCPYTGQQEQSDGLAKWMLDLALSSSKLRSMVNGLPSRRNFGMTLSDVISCLLLRCHRDSLILLAVSAFSHDSSCQLVHFNGDNWTKTAALPPDSNYLL